MQFCNIMLVDVTKKLCIFAVDYHLCNSTNRTNMIQTQLLKADKPYQIIMAAGMVGIQVATLIVTEEKLAPDGTYYIDTHSHPVVNYGDKEGLMEKMKSRRSTSDDYNLFYALLPEGAVWNRVEVRDVRVLGLVGADNVPIDLEWFVSFVPSIPSEDPTVCPGYPPLWDFKTTNRIVNLLYRMKRLGIPCSTQTKYVSKPDSDDPVFITLKLDTHAVAEKLVTVQIREDYSPLEGEIEFRVRLDEADPMDCQKTIVRCMRELDFQFIRAGKNLRFIYRQTSEKKDKWEDLLERCTENINSLVWKNRYGLG